MSDKPRDWDIVGAKQILNDYSKPSENVDTGNVYYAATQLEAALEELRKENETLKRELESRSISLEHTRQDWLESQTKLKAAESRIEKVYEAIDNFIECERAIDPSIVGVAQQDFLEALEADDKLAKGNES